MNILLYIFKQFVLRVTETSTWISAIALILYLFTSYDYIISFLVFGIFMPETWWDQITQEYGTKLKNWLNTL